MQTTLFTEDAEAKVLQTLAKTLIIVEIPAEVQRHMEKMSFDQSYCLGIKEKLFVCVFFCT